MKTTEYRQNWYLSRLSGKHCFDESLHNSLTSMNSKRKIKCVAQCAARIKRRLHITHCTKIKDQHWGIRFFACRFVQFENPRTNVEAVVQKMFLFSTEVQRNTATSHFLFPLNRHSSYMFGRHVLFVHKNIIEYMTLQNKVIRAINAVSCLCFTRKYQGITIYRDRGIKRERSIVENKQWLKGHEQLFFVRQTGVKLLLQCT